LARANYDQANYRAQKLKSTPVWANKFFIREAYALAVLRTKIVGSRFVVDHIVPLNSNLVCGLHCERNLRVIPERENLLKSNRHWPDMPTIHVKPIEITQ